MNADFVFGFCFAERVACWVKFSADDILKSVIFPRKKGSEIPCKLKTFCMKSVSPFSGNKRNKISVGRLLK